MNVTERARRSDALYCDTTRLHRRQLCDMIAADESRLEALEDLCRTLLFCMQDDSDCDRCALGGERGELGGLSDTFACDGLREKLIELGVADDG